MSLFKITRGGQAEPVKTPKQFAQFDVLQAIVDRDIASFLLDRDKIARKLKAKYGLLPQGRFVPELATLSTPPKATKRVVKSKKKGIDKLKKTK